MGPINVNPLSPAVCRLRCSDSCEVNRECKERVALGVSRCRFPISVLDLAETPPRFR